MPKRYKRDYGVRRSIPHVDKDLNGTNSSIGESQGSSRKPKHFVDTKDNIYGLLLENTTCLLETTDHNLFPAMNRSGKPDEESNYPLPWYPRCHCSTPLPLYVVNNPAMDDDICHRRPMHKETYHKLLAITRSTYQRARKNKTGKRSENGKMVYHGSVYDMAQRIDLNPDSFINSSYDYYFTKGNLAILPETQSIVQVHGDGLQTIGIYQYPKNNRIDFNCLIERGKSSPQQQEDDGEIFEILPFQTNVNGGGDAEYFLSRSSNTIKLHQWMRRKRKSENNDNAGGIINTLTKMTNAVPICSMAQCSRNLENLLITTIREGTIHHYNVERNTMKPLKSYTLPDHIPDSVSWNSIISYDESKFLYINQTKLYFIDLRTNSEQWLKYDVDCDNLKCDYLTAIKRSSFDHLVYVASAHKLHCLDLRYIHHPDHYRLPEESRYNVCEWTHQCKFPPILMSTQLVDNSEYIALSSALAGDLCICELNSHRNMSALNCSYALEEITPNIHYGSSVLPYQPPSALQALDMAHSSGICLDPRSNLQTRLRYSTTGLVFQRLKRKHHENLWLLYSNTQGDIFGHCLNSDMNLISNLNQNNNTIMQQFNAHIIEHYKPILNYSKIFQFRNGLRKIFQSDERMVEDNDDGFSHNDVQNDDMECEWQSNSQKHRDTLKQLHGYKDLLVKDILAIWDQPNEEEEEEVEKECGEKTQESGSENNRSGNLLPDNLLETEPIDKVNQWLETYTDNNPEPLEDDEQEMAYKVTNPSPDSKPERKKKKVQRTMEMNAEPSSVQDTLKNVTAFLSSQGGGKKPSKKSKKSKKYIKGF